MTGEPVCVIYCLLSTALWDEYSCYRHVTDGETEAQGGSAKNSRSCSKWQGRYWNPAL